MRELDILSIVKHGQTYKVRYASSHPYDTERQVHCCLDEESLMAFLEACGLDAWSLHQAVTALRKGQMAVVPLVLPAVQVARYFPEAQAVPCHAKRGSSRW